MNAIIKQKVDIYIVRA